jgi:DNA-binding response OmpR family regulator
MVRFKPTILVIDDDPDTLELLKIELETAGYRVLTADSWTEARNRIRNAFDSKLAINVIILDLMMPVHSGFDVLRSLPVMMDPSPPVIVLSALTSLDDNIRAREMGAIKYLTKPTSRKALLDAVREALKVGIKSTWRDLKNWREEGWEKKI